MALEVGPQGAGFAVVEQVDRTAERGVPDPLVVRPVEVALVVASSTSLCVSFACRISSSGRPVKRG